MNWARGSEIQRFRESVRQNQRLLLPRPVRRVLWRGLQ